MAKEQASAGTRVAIAGLVALTMLLAGMFVYQSLAPSDSPRAAPPKRPVAAAKPTPPRAKPAPIGRVEPRRHAPAPEPVPQTRVEPAPVAKSDEDIPRRDLGIRNETIGLYAPMAASCIREARVRKPSQDVSFEIVLDVLARPGHDTRVLGVSLSHPRVTADAELTACIEKTASIVDLPEIKYAGRQKLKMAVSAEGF